MIARGGNKYMQIFKNDLDASVIFNTVASIFSITISWTPILIPDIEKTNGCSLFDMDLKVKVDHEARYQHVRLQ